MAKIKLTPSPAKELHEGCTFSFRKDSTRYECTNYNAKRKSLSYYNRDTERHYWDKKVEPNRLVWIWKRKKY